LNVANISSPIWSEQSSLNKAVEAAMRPIGYATDVAVFHRIKVNIVDVSLEIFVIPNRMFPIAALPNTLFPLGNFTG
jgi:hypothetical protein